MTAFIVECDEDVSDEADRLVALIDDWQEGRITLAEYTAHIAKAIQAERDDHAKTAKSQVDLLSVLGCVHMRVQRFKTEHEALPAGAFDLGAPEEEAKGSPDASLTEFIAALERMVGEGSPDPRLMTVLEAIEAYGNSKGACPDATAYLAWAKKMDGVRLDHPDMRNKPSSLCGQEHCAFCKLIMVATDVAFGLDEPKALLP